MITIILSLYYSIWGNINILEFITLLVRRCAPAWDSALPELPVRHALVCPILLQNPPLLYFRLVEKPTPGRILQPAGAGAGGVEDGGESCDSEICGLPCNKLIQHMLLLVV